MLYLRLSRYVVLLAALLAASPYGRAVDDPRGERPEELIAPLPPGVLGRPFGEAVVVQGKVVDGPWKFESPNVGRFLVQRINGVATQQGVVLRFNPITLHELWIELDAPLPEGEALYRIQEKKLERMLGKSFEMRGYEHGQHIGMNAEDMYITDDVQGGWFRFYLSFKPMMMKAIPEVRFAPADFSGRKAELEGRAETRGGSGCLIGPDGWLLQVRETVWPSEFEGREISATGRVSKAADGTWRMEGADARLVHLRDQLGREVKLDGDDWSLQHGWFEYRGEKLYVEKPEGEPAWVDRLGVVTMAGVLEQANLPDIDQLGVKTEPALRVQYILRRPTRSALDIAWKKPPEIPKAPRLTVEYVESCGIKFEERRKWLLEKRLMKEEH